LKKDDIVGNTTPLPVPALITQNQPLFSRYCRGAYSIILNMLNSLNASLGLPEGTLANLHRLHEKSGDHVRFIRAPPGPGQSGAPHTDFGSLTVLFNWLGGLQVRLPPSPAQAEKGEAGDWVWVKPVPGCAIVNLGDALVLFTAGLFRSNIHRVLNPPGEQEGETRYSLVYFSRPEDKVVMGRLKGGVIDRRPRSEGENTGLTSKEWILKRGLANVSILG
jgi:isopenicillin N synthase-like dioxygenase